MLAPPVDKALLDEEISQMPDFMKVLATEFPVATMLELEGYVFYVLGYSAPDKLIASQLNPAIDYNAAMRTQQYICVKQLRARKPH